MIQHDDQHRATWQLSVEDFKNQFVPDRECDYGWAVQYAKDQYNAAVATFRRLDDKASSIVGYLGAGSGVLTFSAIAALTTGKIGVNVAIATIPAIIAAAFALWSIAKARLTTGMVTPPNAAVAVGYVEYHPGNTAEAAFIPHWVWATRELSISINQKADWVDRAIKASSLSIVLLLLPLFLAIFEHCGYSLAIR